MKNFEYTKTFFSTIFDSIEMNVDLYKANTLKISDRK